MSPSFSLWSFTPPVVRSKPKTGVPATHEQIWRGFGWWNCLQNYGCCLWSVIGRNCTFVRWALKGINPQKRVANKPGTLGGPDCIWGSWILPMYRSWIAELCHFFSVCVARGELRSEQGLSGSGDAWSRWWGALVPLQGEGHGEHPGVRFAPWRRCTPRALLWGRGSEEGQMTQSIPILRH